MKKKESLHSHLRCSCSKKKEQKYEKENKSREICRGRGETGYKNGNIDRNVYSLLTHPSPFISVSLIFRFTYDVLYKNIHIIVLWE